MKYIHKITGQQIEVWSQGDVGFPYGVDVVYEGRKFNVCNIINDNDYLIKDSNGDYRIVVESQFLEMCSSYHILSIMESVKIN